jgi:hypothetical protein
VRRRGCRRVRICPGGNLPDAPDRAAWDRTWYLAAALRDVRKYRKDAAEKGSYTPAAQLARQEADLLREREADWRAFLDRQPKAAESLGDVLEDIPGIVDDLPGPVFAVLCRAVDARRRR